MPIKIRCAREVIKTELECNLAKNRLTTIEINFPDIHALEIRVNAKWICVIESDGLEGEFLGDCARREEKLVIGARLAII